MSATAIIVGALFVFYALMHFLGRRTSRSLGRSNRLGTVSQHWLHVHRAEDQ
jgi:hypothetical protein